MVKFNVSILNRLEIIVFFVNRKYIHKHNVIFNKTITKLVTILKKYIFFQYVNPASYLNSINMDLKCCLEYLQTCLNDSSEVAEKNIIIKQWISKEILRKYSSVYCFLLKLLLSNKNIPTTLPLSCENCFVKDFKEKAELCNFFLNNVP